MSSCVREEIHVRDTAPYASVYYDYWTGPDGTVIDGDIYNDGHRYIDAVQLEVRLFDRRGGVFATDYYWVNTYSYPGEASYFTIDIPDPYVADVDVQIVRYDY